MGYRNEPIFLKTKTFTTQRRVYTLTLSCKDMSCDFRHSSPILREILGEFLDGAYLQTSGNVSLYFGAPVIFVPQKSYVRIKENENLIPVYKVEKNDFTKDAFLENFCGDNICLAYKCEKVEDIEKNEPLCSLFNASFNKHLSNALFDNVFFQMQTYNKGAFDTLLEIIEKAFESSNRILIKGKEPTVYSQKTCERSHALDKTLGYFINERVYTEKNVNFLNYPLYFFQKSEKTFYLATSKENKLAGLNRLFDGVFLRALSKKYDIAICFYDNYKHFKNRSQKVDEEWRFIDFIGTNPCSYTDKYKTAFVITQMDDCMYCDMFKTQSREIKLFEKGEHGHKLSSPVLKIRFSPNTLNSNLILELEMYNLCHVKKIKNIFQNCCEDTKREIIFDKETEIVTFPEYVICNSKTNCDVFPQETKKKGFIGALKEYLFRK